MEAENFPHDALDAVARDTVAVFFTDAYSHFHPVRRKIEQGEPCGKALSGTGKNFLKFGIFLNPIVFHVSKTIEKISSVLFPAVHRDERKKYAHRAQKGNDSIRCKSKEAAFFKATLPYTLLLSGKMRSALVSSSLEHSSSGIGRHSLSETVHLLACSLFGLISSLHFCILLFL